MRTIAMLIIICITLSACGGFKLRGSLNVPSYLKTVYITPNAPYEPLQRELRSRLAYYNVKILHAPSANTTILNLSQVSKDEQPLAVGYSGEVQRYKLSLTASYTLTIVSQNNLRQQQTITRTRELNRSNNMLLSNESEAQTVQKELLHEIVNELLRQITKQPQQCTEPTQCSSDKNNSPC